MGQVPVTSAGQGTSPTPLLPGTVLHSRLLFHLAQGKLTYKLNTAQHTHSP